jgi:hypothetical protein
MARLLVLGVGGDGEPMGTRLQRLPCPRPWAVAPVEDTGLAVIVPVRGLRYRGSGHSSATPELRTASILYLSYR